MNAPPAALAAALFAVDPVGIGGVVLRAAAGPARDAWLATLRTLLPAPPRRLPLHADDARLLGGLDLTATLSGGRRVVQSGLLAECDGGVLVVAMAERVSPALAARLASALDTGQVQLQRDGLQGVQPARIGIVALDEGIGDDEQVPAALRERLALHVQLDGGAGAMPPGDGAGAAAQRDAARAVVRRDVPGTVAPEDATGAVTPRDSAGAVAQPGAAVAAAAARTDAAGAVRQPDAADLPTGVTAARALLPDVTAPDDVVEALCAAAAAIGIDSLRVPLLALRVARAAAALGGRTAVAADDVTLAARWVLAPRARCLPPAPEAPAASPPEEAQRDADDTAAGDDEAADPGAQELPEQILEAALSALPPGLLLQLRAGAAPRRGAATSGRSGAAQRSRQRGRPIGSERGDPRRARLDLLATLRAAAPWQSLRQAESGRSGLQLRRDDFHIRRHRDRRETTTIFAVDASGSAALHRLAEAKGAVELLLADCYVRRDRVALFGFRGSAAELLLPPTRSLPRAKRSLAELPGGGGTPLAAGIAGAQALAAQIARGGGSATVVLLTDGRANVARDGKPGRAAAHADALAAARVFAAGGTQALLIDTSPQPQGAAREVAAAMRARYLALPHADARQVAAAVQASVSAG